MEKEKEKQNTNMQPDSAEADTSSSVITKKHGKHTIVFINGKKKTLLKRLGIFMIVVGLVYLAAAIIRIVQDLMIPEFAYEEFSDYVTLDGHLTYEGISTEAMCQILACITYGYYALQCLLFFRNGMMAYRFSGRVGKENKMLRKAIFLVSISSIAMILALVKPSVEKIVNAGLTEIVVLVYLAGTITNWKAVKAYKLEHQDEAAA